MAKGLPVLHCKAEMEHYGVKSRYRNDYWSNHYLCLWEVTPEEVVGTWRWRHLRKYRNWFEDIVEPAVKTRRWDWKHRLARDGESLEAEDDVGVGTGRTSKLEAHEQLHATGETGMEDDDRAGEVDDSDGSVVEGNWFGKLAKMYENLELEESP